VYDGEGRYGWADGCSYEGGWSEGKMHGEGTYTDKDNVKFEGKFFNGKYDNGRAYVHLR